MTEKTKNLHQSTHKPYALDHFDRIILEALVDNAQCPYAALGELAGLSPPAVHERVKRLRKAGVIESSSARLNGAAIGKPLLAFVHVDFDGWGKSQKLMDLAQFPEIEEMHSVAGNSGMVLKVRTADAHALEQLLAQLYALSGVRTTQSYIVLSTFIERPAQAGMTQDWPDMMLVED